MFKRETKIKKFKENLFAFREHEQRMSVNSITNKESVDMGAFFDRLKTFDGLVAQARKLNLLADEQPFLTYLKNIAYDLNDELIALDSHVHAYATHKFMGVFDIRGNALRCAIGSMEEVLTGKRPTRRLYLGRTNSSAPITPATFQRLDEKGRWRNI